MLEQIILGLFEIGYADHELSDPELRYIKKVSQIFGIDQNTFKRLRNSRPEFVKEDPYKVLGVKKSQSTVEIKKTYRNLARKNHPGASNFRSPKYGAIWLNLRNTCFLLS